MNRIRLVIYRSNKALEAQLVESGKTVIGKKFVFDGKQKPIEQAKAYGQAFAKLLNEKEIKQIAYDRNGFRYHGRVKSFAEGLREAGIEF